MSYEIYNANPLIWIHADGTETNLELVESILFNYIDIAEIVHETTILAASFIIQTPTKITFSIPDVCDFSAALIQADISDIIPGTMFSGSVFLGPNGATIANGSGIYKLEVGLTHDTLYVDSSIDNVTANVGIPDPIFRTGFIGG